VGEVETESGRVDIKGRTIMRCNVRNTSFNDNN
jgi:hypothetical protein